MVELHRALDSKNITVADLLWIFPKHSTMLTMIYCCINCRAPIMPYLFSLPKQSSVLGPLFLIYRNYDIVIWMLQTSTM